VQDDDRALGAGEGVPPDLPEADAGPVARVDIPQHDRRLAGRGCGGAGCVVEQAARRAHDREGRPVEHVLVGVPGAGKLAALRGVALALEGAVIEGVVGDREARVRDPAPGRRVEADGLAHREERRIHVPVAENTEDLAQGSGAPAVVEGERHHLLVPGAVIDDLRRGHPARALLAGDRPDCPAGSGRLGTDGCSGATLRRGPWVSRGARAGAGGYGCTVGHAGRCGEAREGEHAGEDEDTDTDPADDRGLRKAPERQLGRWGHAKVTLRAGGGGARNLHGRMGGIRPIQRSNDGWDSRSVARVRDGLGLRRAV
jgi:hypothetical protein